MNKIGLGTYKHVGTGGANFIAKAIDIGYRLIDTADHYKNHDSVKNAIKLSGVDRGEIEICTKVWRENLSANFVETSVERFLNELEVDYIDTVLIHWPNSKFNMQEAFSVLEDYRDKGIIKNAGVSNFTINHLEQIVRGGGKVDVNQVEYHVSLNQKDLYKYCAENEIKIMAHSGLGGGFDLKIPAVIKLCDKYKVSSANILYAFLIKKGITPVCGADTVEHLIENFNSLNVPLSDNDFGMLDNLNVEKRRVLVKSYSEF